MSAPEVIDAEPLDEHVEEPARHLPEPAPRLAVAPQVKPAELVSRLAAIREAQAEAMEQGVDYGVIPGTDKPTLFKPGAEKLSVLFQLDVQIANEKQWGPDEHLTVISKATVFHAPTGARLGYGEGVCTTRERKYAYRQKSRVCPTCNAEAIIKGKEEYGGGWLCWSKKGGCGAKFADGDVAIEGQDAGEVENPDLPDLWNTVVKMAEKRARVDAVLAVTGASALFTQDMEDSATAEAEAPSAPKPSAGGGGLKVTQKQIDKFILANKRKLGVSDEDFERHLKFFGIASIEDLPRGKADEFVKHMSSPITEPTDDPAQSDVPPDMEGLGDNGDPGPELPFD